MKHKNAFFIQVGNPHVNDLRRKKVGDLQDAIEEVFPCPTEDLILHWNGICIPLSYKYDVSDYFIQWMGLIERICSAPTGNASEVLASNSFNAQWNLVWGENKIQCDAKWLLVPGDADSLNKHCRLLEIDRAVFLAEWKCLFDKIATSVDRSGIQIEDLIEVERLTRLRKQMSLFDAIPFAYLYASTEG